MIGSFWNLCRACPSMPVDKIYIRQRNISSSHQVQNIFGDESVIPYDKKCDVSVIQSAQKKVVEAQPLHSEYRSTYRWHEYTGNSKPEVVRKPPIPNQFASSTEHFFSKSMEDEKTTEGPINNEPPLPRRKKCPELAYKTHEFIIGTDGPIPNLRNDTSSVTRARSEERGKSSRRSKSEGPPGLANGGAFPIPCDNDVVGVKANGNVQAGESSGLFKKTITKLSTEYRLQFVWPHVRKAIKGDTNDAVDLPRKSLSMGAIKSSQTNALPTVHKKRTTNEKEATVYELEPLVNDVEEKKVIEKQPVPAERKTTRPFSQALDSERQNQYITRKENYGFKTEDREREKTGMEEALTQGTTAVQDNKTMVNGTGVYGEEWYKEVIELRKKAGEYKCRGWGIEIDPELYKKQRDLWDQVSRRSSLSALSLASSIHRPITKEEKEQENNKKTSPTKHASKGRVPGQAHLIDNKTIPDGPILPARVQTIRHHLERTTGPDVEEGALLPSPTREKLMPAIPKSKESEQYSSQRGSPKKTAASRHGSPQKGSPQKGSPKKTIKGRSQSVGPAVIDSNESPKRQIRSGSTAPTTASTIKAHKKTPASTPTTGERRPRPSTLSTSTHSRLKSSSLPPNGRAHSAPGNHHHIQLSQNDTNKTSTVSSNQSQVNLRKTKKSSKHLRPKSAVIVSNAMTEPTTIVIDGQTMTKGQDKKLAENEDEKEEKDGGVSISSSSPQPPPEPIPEHIVKSPPEPTRVKSPEQIIMRSPDPVNWTVPLDTGKTFTVTQNVKEGGELYSRPSSEFKASTPIDRPPPAPQSAPPELAEQAKMEAWKNSDRSEISESDTGSPSKSIIVPEVRYDKPIPGSTLRCLDDPTYNIEPSGTTSTAPRNLATDALEKARERFDRFWSGNKEENV